MPEGASYEDVFGNEEKNSPTLNGWNAMKSRSTAKMARSSSMQTYGGVGSGFGAGISGGIMAAPSGNVAPTRIREADSGPETAAVRGDRQQTPSSKTAVGSRTTARPAPTTISK